MTVVRTTITMTVDDSDFDEVVGIFKTFIKDVEEKDNGVLTYQYFIDDDPLRIHVIEEYEDGAAHLEHYAHIDMQAVGRLLELVQPSEAHYYGEPTLEEQELLAGFGTVRYHRPLVGIAGARAG